MIRPYYYRARYYDPEIGRFVSEDPLGFAAGDVNFYAYVGNNPINNNDPSGQFVCGGICIGIAVGVGTSIATGSAIRGGVEAVTNPNATTSSILSAAGDPKGLAIDTGLGLVGGGFAQLAKARQISQLAPVLKGAEGEALIAQRLSNQGLNFEQQVTIRGGGAKPRIDFGVDTGNGLLALEVKTGSGARLTNPQSTLMNFIDNGGTGIATGKNAGQFAGQEFNAFQELRLSPFNFPASTGSIAGTSAGLSGAANASGGFVLYPSKPNTNMLQRVYRK